MKSHDAYYTDLRAMRRALDLKQGEIAARCGCSIATISLAERGKLNTPTQRRWTSRIARVLREIDQDF